MNMNDIDLSIIIPVYNEEDIIENTVIEVECALRPLDYAYEIILVDDGSKDDTWKTIERIEKMKRGGIFKGILFSRNFGKEAALLAGLAYSKGRAVITMDSDLQHPPERIPEFITEWENGYKIVEGVKKSRGNETTIHHVFTGVFYKILSRAVGKDMNNTSDFKLLDREIVDVILKMPEKQMFYRAITAWVGFKSTTVEFNVQKRIYGESKWTAVKLTQYAIRNITSFTSVPLQLITVLGGLFFLLAIFVGIFAMIKWVNGSAVEGFSTVILLQLIYGSITMFAMGLMGYYISKLSDEIRNRPRYIVEKEIGIDEKTEND